MPEGTVSVCGVIGPDGKHIPAKQAVDAGIISLSSGYVHPSWMPKSEISLGMNTFTDTGRKHLAYLFGGRTPVQDYVCTQFGAGTSNVPATASDTGIVAPVQFSSGLYVKDVDSIVFDEDYVCTIQLTLGSDDANGYLIRELGLYAGNGALLARKTGYSINKSSGFAPVLLWRITF